MITPASRLAAAWSDYQIAREDGYLAEFLGAADKLTRALADLDPVEGLALAFDFHAGMFEADRAAVLERGC